MNDPLMPIWLSQTLAIVGVLVALATAYKVVFTPAVRGLRRLGHFLDDWTGEPGRHGQPDRPGVVERLESVEAAVEVVRKELRPNGGGSLRDAVDRVESTLGAAVTAVDERLEAHMAASTEDHAAIHDRIDDHMTESTADRAALHAVVDALATETHEHHDTEGGTP